LPKNPFELIFAKEIKQTEF